MQKTWQQKYKSYVRPTVKIAAHRYADVKRGAKVLVSTPAEIEKELRKIPEGREMTIRELRGRLARKHLAEVTCPVTTGAYLHIVAENALDQMDAGVPSYQTAPFWRVITPWSSLARKLSCGLSGLIVLRSREGLPVR